MEEVGLIMSLLSRALISVIHQCSGLSFIHEADVRLSVRSYLALILGLGAKAFHHLPLFWIYYSYLTQDSGEDFPVWTSMAFMFAPEHKYAWLYQEA